jgi:putative nucleotidyltransferase with HDIG domain
MKDERLRVLYVDDEPLVCQAFARTLARERLQVHTATSVVEAMQLLGSSPFAIIASDYNMPQTDGVTFLSATRIAFPDARRILISGFCDFDMARQAINRAGIDQIVVKPWANDELVRTVLRAGEVYNLSQEQRLRRQEMGTKVQELEQVNFELDTQVQTLSVNLLDGLIRALDLRDAGTQWHSRRVATYARRVAAAMQLSTKEMDDVERGALLHDIGKIGISDAILGKPGKLTASERVEMQRHVVLGYQLLSGIGYLSAARVIILQSHECWDGAGYPAGLAGAEIVPGARIFSVADTMDAITSDRCYRARRSFAEARAEILRCSGTQFDPAVVAAYAAVSDEEWSGLAGRLTARVELEPIESTLAGRLSVVYREFDRSPRRAA